MNKKEAEEKARKHIRKLALFQIPDYKKYIDWFKEMYEDFEIKKNAEMLKSRADELLKETRRRLHE